jgi:hypothetical protein
MRNRGTPWTIVAALLLRTTEGTGLRRGRCSFSHLAAARSTLRTPAIHALRFALRRGEHPATRRWPGRHSVSPYPR